MDRVVIGMDPHERSVTIEVMASDETVLDAGRYATDGPGYGAMLRHAKQWPEHLWAVEGCSGIGRHVATRSLADGEQVVDVPPKLSARARVFVTSRTRRDRAYDRAPSRLLTQRGAISGRASDSGRRGATGKAPENCSAGRVEPEFCRLVHFVPNTPHP